MKILEIWTLDFNNDTNFLPDEKLFRNKKDRDSQKKKSMPKESINIPNNLNLP